MAVCSFLQEPGDRFYVITRGTAIVSARDSALASPSTSDDDTDADTDADDSVGVEMSSTSTVKSYTTYQPSPGEEHSREHVGGREGSVASTESVKGGGCGDGSYSAMADVKSQHMPLDSVVWDIAVEPKSTQSLEEQPPPPTNAGEQVLTRLYEGNTFGEMALVYDEPRTSTVHAVTEVGSFVSSVRKNMFMSGGKVAPFRR